MEESWNKAKAYPTFIRKNTKLVENCINPKQREIQKIVGINLKSDLFSFLLNKTRNTKHQNNPIKHQKTKQVSTEESKIIFFKIAASIPVKSIERNLYWISFRFKIRRENPSFVVLKINRLPKIIKIIPKNDKKEGISFSKKIANNKPIKLL